MRCRIVTVRRLKWKLEALQDGYSVPLAAVFGQRHTSHVRGHIVGGVPDMVKGTMMKLIIRKGEGCLVAALAKLPQINTRWLALPYDQVN
jgi:hypothetical protein